MAKYFQEKHSLFPHQLVCHNEICDGFNTSSLRVVIYILLLFVVGCGSNVDWHYEGDSKELLLSETDIPSGWHLEAEGTEQLSNPGTENRFVRYNMPPDDFLTNSLIAHSIIIFASAEEAAEYMTTDYQISRDLIEQIAEGKEIQWPEYTPPPRHTYESSLADEVKLLYYPEGIIFSAVGNNYNVWGRYGNVVSTFTTIVEDPETTQITAEEANVVPWSEVERMLKRIDQNFAEAGKPSR